jgi:hypothetical protein
MRLSSREDCPTLRAMSSHQQRMTELRAELEAVNGYAARLTLRHLQGDEPNDERSVLLRRLITALRHRRRLLRPAACCADCGKALANRNADSGALCTQCWQQARVTRRAAQRERGVCAGCGAAVPSHSSWALCDACWKLERLAPAPRPKRPLIPARGICAGCGVHLHDSPTSSWALCDTCWQKEHLDPPARCAGCGALLRSRSAPGGALCTACSERARLARRTPKPFPRYCRHCGIELRESASWQSSACVACLRTRTPPSYQNGLSYRYGSGNVSGAWVRGYFRRDGTYVQPHSRNSHTRRYGR